MLYKSNFNSPLGLITLISDEDSLIRVIFGGLKPENKDIISKETEIQTKTKRWLEKYFNGENPSAKELKYKINTSHFSDIVLKEVLKIEYSKTMTYGELAKRVAKQLNKEKMSAQAVGNALNKNPLLIIIPCHRVVAKNSIGGYCLGKEIKTELLKLESGFRSF